jgi:hypothetical protein
VAAAATDKPLQGTQVGVSEPLSFGAYGSAANPLQNLAVTQDRPPESKLNGSLDFTDSDKRWLKDLGITTTDPNSHHRAWENEEDKYRSKHRQWRDTYTGRIAMRSVSRGIVGAAFYTVGSMYGGKALKNYSPDHSLKESENVLQFIAKLIDSTVGKGIHGTVKLLRDEKAADKAVFGFRDTVKFAEALATTPSA